MKTKISLAAMALAALMLAMPATAEAGFVRHGAMKRDCLFGWLMRDEAKKVVKKGKKKKVAKKKGKKGKKGKAKKEA
jgi:hypothetical protein